MEKTEVILKTVEIIIPSTATFLAGYVGLRYGFEQVKLQRRMDFIEKQLQELYSPLYGCLVRIKAKSSLRVRVHDAAGKVWQGVCDNSPRPFLEHDKEFVPFKQLIEYDNKELRDEILPLYRKMRDVFTEKIWLAEAETRKWYGPFSDFIEIWDRWLTEKMPRGVLEELNHSEEALKPFYSDIEGQIEKLKSTYCKPAGLFQKIGLWISSQQRSAKEFS